MSYRPYSGPTWPTRKRKSNIRKRGRRPLPTKEPELFLTLLDQLTKETP